MKVFVIGGGPAGMMAAISAAKSGHSVYLFERNEKLGKKMCITGKGRCNITNAGDDLISNVISNASFLYSAFSRFSNYDAIDFFEKIGVKTKVERGMRVFPENDSAPSVVTALKNHLKSLGIKAVHSRITKIIVKDGAVFAVLTADGKKYACDAAVLATGGVSYPQTGSTGDGHKIAKALGHTITPLLPSLVPLSCKEEFCSDLSGLSLRNIGFKIMDGKNTVYEDFGEMLFTHFGISGPVVLSGSSHIKTPAGMKAVIDLKPALTPEELDRRLLRDFTEFSNRDFINSLSELLPKSLIEIMVELSGIDGRKKCRHITKEERLSFGNLLKNFTLEISGFRPIAEAIVTSGGVATDEINPKTMESKKVKNLYFAGEIIDVDAYTGGYNLQIAYSTGFVAGSSIGKE